MVDGEFKAQVTGFRLSIREIPMH